MTKNFLVFCITLFGVAALKAQIIISPTYSKTSKKIDKKIEVVSNLPDSSWLGYVPSDIPNDRKNIKPSSNNIDTWLQSFVDKQFSSSTDTKAKKLLWVIQDLTAGKDSTQKDTYSFIKLKADIYDNTKKDTDYELVNTFDSTWIMKNTNADFGEMIATAFEVLYDNSIKLKKGAANKRFQEVKEKLTGTKEEIAKKMKLATNLQILKDSVYTSGIYASFNEFKSNKPGITNFYAKVDSQSNKVNLYQILADSSSQLVQKAWGASINNELYYYSSNQLYPIEKSGNTFYIAKYLEPRTRKNQGLYWRKYVGKYQGDTNPYNDAHVVRKSVESEKTVAIETTHLDFDMEDFIY